MILIPYIQTTIHSRSRKRSHSALSWYLHTQNPHKRSNRNIQEAHIHGHYHPPHLQPPHTPQIRSSQVPIQQTRLLQQEQYQHELNIIHNILQNNAFPIKHHKPPTHNPLRPRAPRTTKQKWTSFTYLGKETSYITNLFRTTKLKIAFRTTNTIGNLLSHKIPNPDKFSLSGVYRLTYPDCNKTYVGQTHRYFATWYKEHETAFRNNSHTSSFAKHLNEDAHFFGSMNSIMQVLHCHKKGAHMNTIERFHIHREFAANNNFNDNQTVFPNAIFDTLTKTTR